MSLPSQHILDQLLLHHPELVELRSRGGAAVAAAMAAPELAHLLIGSSEEVRSPLVTELMAHAADELAILCGVCRGNTLRTVTTTVTILVFLARNLDREEGEEAEGEQGEEGKGSPHTEMVEQAFDKVTAQSELLDDLNQLLPDMGWGFGRGHLESALLQDMARFARLLHQAEALKQIAEELGRLERSSRRRTAPRGGRAAVVGVRVSGELADALPSELALLASASTEDLFYQRYTDHRLLSLEFEGALEGAPERGGEGPVIVCVDTSGSMSGTPEVIAKALVLVVMRRVLPKGRRVRLMLFGGAGEFQDRDIGRGPGAMSHFLDLLAMHFHAGTDFDGPLERALDLLDEERYSNADVLLVTDGYASASPRTVRRVRALRQEVGFAVVSVVIGGSPHGVAAFSDRVWRIPAHEGALEHIEITEWNGQFTP